MRERPKPVGSGRFRDHAQDASRVLGMFFPPPLLAMKRVVWYTLTGDHNGEEDALLAQLRLPLETRSKRISPDKRILFPVPQSLPCSPVGGTDVPSTMPLRGREENESEFRPRHVARRATKGGHASRLTPHGEANPSNESVGEESTLFTRSTR